MTRAKSILDLRRRYAQAVRDRKHKLASEIAAQMRPLVTRQIREENRKDRRQAA